MIDSISTSSVQSSSLRYSPQSLSSVEVAQTVATSAALPTTRIRVDNNLNRAIIEVRSSDEVVRQYPTEAQLRAFARAESLKLEQKQEQPSQQSAAPVSADTGSAAPQPQAETQQAAPVSAPASAPNPAAYSGSAATSGAPSQSIEV